MQSKLAKSNSARSQLKRVKLACISKTKMCIILTVTKYSTEVITLILTIAKAFLYYG